MDARLEEIKAILKKYGQEHLLNHYDKLDDVHKQKLLEEIENIDFELVDSLYRSTEKKEKSTKDEITPIDYLDKYKLNEKYKYYENIGKKAIKEGKLAAVTMAGGQGTRLGHNGPKGTYDIGLNSHKSLFELLCDRLKEEGKKYGVTIPWFLDWGRDTLIAFEGLLLVTKRFKIAKEVLKTMIRDIKFGLVPNGYSGYDNRPLYNSVDASLLLFEAVQKYINYTGDYQFIKEEIYKKLEDIIESYIKGIDVDNNNIYLDDDDLIVSGTQDTQNTWMDAKYDGVAITPRSGKAVEVNSLWYNANKIMADLSKKFGHSQNAKKYKLIAEKCKKSFNDKFYNKRRKCLYDVLGDSKIRPNQLFALSLTYPVIEADSEEAKNIISVVEKKLLNAYGLKTLAKGEENYVEVYEGDGKKRDSSYHQGITWPWLLGLYYNALKNILKKTKKKDAKKELETKLEKFIEKTSKTFQKEISHNGCIGSISELYDSRKPYLPKGTIAQAWSVAEVFRIILNK